MNIDIWTPVHAGSGFILGLGGVSPVASFAVQLTAVLFEQTLKVTEKDKALHMIGGMGTGMLLYVWGRHLRT